MNGPMTISVLAGLFTLAASACVGLIEILSSPERVNYPTARAHVRAAIFLWAVFLAYRGVEIIFQAICDTPRFVSPGTFYVSATLLLAQGALLEHQLRSWLPARVHEHIRMMMKVASCRHPSMIHRKGLKVRVQDK